MITLRKRFIDGLLLLLIALLISTALLRVVPLLYSYPTTYVKLDYDFNKDTSGTRLDAVLLENLQSLRDTRIFAESLAKEARSLTLKDPLWVDKCEVRQGDFYKFRQWYIFNPQVDIKAPNQPSDWQYYSDSHNHKISGRLDAPANNIGWYDAFAYCQAVGGRLPKPDEWLAVATGKQQRIYPWGNTFVASGFPYIDPILNAAQKCNAQPETQTPEGIADLGQNVSEWTDNQNYADSSVAVMGANANDTAPSLHSIVLLYRRTIREYRSPYLGFRCVYDKVPRTTPWQSPSKVIHVKPSSYQIGIPSGAHIPILLRHLPSNRLDVIKRIYTQAQSESQEFYISNEITRREYARFLLDPLVRFNFYAEVGEPKEHNYQPSNWEQQLSQPNLPVVNIDWWSAYAFASWAGGRLPSAEEWLLIASNQGAHVYPWGNSFDPQKLVSGESKLGGPQEINMDLKSALLEPLHLGGNVSEWTRSVSIVQGSYSIIVKGGNYLLPGKQTARIDFNNYISPHYRSATIGFRVVFDSKR